MTCINSSNIYFITNESHRHPFGIFSFMIWWGCSDLTACMASGHMKYKSLDSYIQRPNISVIIQIQTFILPVFSSHLLYTSRWYARTVFDLIAGPSAWWNIAVPAGLYLVKLVVGHCVHRGKLSNPRGFKNTICLKSIINLNFTKSLSITSNWIGEFFWQIWQSIQ